MFILILLLSLNSFFISGVISRFLGRNIAVFLSTSSIFFLFLISIFIFYEICLLGTVVNFKIFNWFLIDIMSISFGFLFDSLTSFMLVIVCLISFFVHLYSLGYMKYDPYLLRFISYLSLFTFFMLILVTADNFVQMFLGWEGVGLCSYLLISFWFTRILANKAAIKAMIMNRISDVFFVYGIILILLFFKTSDYVMVFFLFYFNKFDSFIFFGSEFFLFNVICFFLFIGSVGKSAQLGLHTWLPDAMEGPTPVSSLLHAATMVTAGVFLILRCSFFFEFSNIILFFVVIIGGVTALFSSIIGVFQYDMKKIIAYSTCSQLGYMFFSCGLSNYNIAIFHLFNHAFFKALLFLSAGSVIHALMDEQDMRKMGSLVNFLPFTYIAFFIGSLAIMGFPFLTGFYSKDLLLELVFCRFYIDSLFIYFLGCIAAFFTSVYSIRLILFVFFNYNISFRSFIFSSESYIQMTFSMFFLSILSIFVGYIFHDMAVGWGSFIWNNSLFLLSSNFSYIDSHFIHFFIKNIPVLLSLFGLFLGIFFVEILKIFKFGFYHIGSYFLFDNKFIFFDSFFKFMLRHLSIFFFYAAFFNSFYNKLFDFFFKWSYSFYNKIIDKGFIEFFGPFGIYKFFRFLSLFSKNNPPAVLFFSVGSMFFFIVCFIFYVFLIFYMPLFFYINPGLLGFIFFIIFRKGFF